VKSLMRKQEKKLPTRFDTDDKLLIAVNLLVRLR